MSFDRFFDRAHPPLDPRPDRLVFFLVLCQFLLGCQKFSSGVRQGFSGGPGTSSPDPSASRSPSFLVSQSLHRSLASLFTNLYRVLLDPPPLLPSSCTIFLLHPCSSMAAWLSSDQRPAPPPEKEAPGLLLIIWQNSAVPSLPTRFVAPFPSLPRALRGIPLHCCPPFPMLSTLWFRSSSSYFKVF